jgi:mandelate racemase
LVGTQTGLTISNLRARMVNVPMERPVQTSAGEIRAALLVLIDLQTEEGITGRAYVRSYSTFALEPLKQLVENLGAALAGEALAPLEIYRKLQAMFRLLGPQGLTVTASSARPIASTSTSRVRAPALRSSALSLAKASSMGLRSGE